MALRTANTVFLPNAKVIFFLAPKCANSAVKAAVLTALGLDGEWCPDDVPHHHPALRIRPKDTIDRQYDDFMKIGLVRNPFDRLVSCWAQKICTDRVQIQGFMRLGFIRDMPFPDFTAMVAENPLANPHFAPQVNFVPADLDYLARCETLTTDWSVIRKIIGDRFPRRLGRLPKINTSDHGHYSQYFDDHSRELATAVYHQDLERFEYRWA
jgi:chondroitin 4-sulfotransferase 11